MKDVLLFVMSLILVGIAAYEFMSYNPFGHYLRDPMVGDLYLCDRYQYSDHATHVSKVYGVSKEANLVRVISVPLSKVGGNVMEAADKLDNIETEILTMRNIATKLRLQMEKIDANEPEWDIMYSLTNAVERSLVDNLYAASADSLKRFKNSCRYISNQDIMEFWKEK